MDGETENEVKNDRVVSAGSSIEEDNSPIKGRGKEGVRAVASDQDEGNSKSVKATEKEAPVGEKNSGNEYPDLDVKVNKVSEQPVSHKESFVSEINDGPPGLHLETPQRQNTSQDEADKEEESTAGKESISYEEYMQLHQQLSEDRYQASQHHSSLQMKLSEFFRKNAVEDAQLDREVPVSEQLQQYENYVDILTDLKRQLITDSQTAKQQAEELRSKSQEKQDKAENEWRAFLALKLDVAVPILSRRLSKLAAQGKVEATLESEKLLQHELIKLRLKHVKMKIKIHRLEAELREGEEHARDPVHLQFVQLQAERLELKRRAVKQKEESLKLQKKISGSLELLSNIKEKLFWIQMEVQGKQEQLAKVEAVVARKRELLSGTRQARNRLQKDNLRLKQHRGLLGHRVLLRDFEDTVDASDHMEERLEDLKCRQAEIVFSCGRRKTT